MANFTVTGQLNWADEDWPCLPPRDKIPRFGGADVKLNKQGECGSRLCNLNCDCTSCKWKLQRHNAIVEALKASVERHVDKKRRGEDRGEQSVNDEGKKKIHIESSELENGPRKKGVKKASGKNEKKSQREKL